jgi:hypothetical protein
MIDPLQIEITDQLEIRYYRTPCSLRKFGVESLIHQAMIRTLAALLLLAASLPLCAQDTDSVQSWTSSDGRVIQAKFVKLEGQAVVIEREGRRFTLPFAKLSPASVAQAKELGDIVPGVPEHASHPPTGDLGSEQIISLRDGQFHVETTRKHRVEAVLRDRWTSPEASSGELGVFAPVLPVLDNQSNVSTDLSVEGPASQRKQVFQENRLKREMIKLEIPMSRKNSKDGIATRLEYKATINDRRIVHGKPPTPVPDLENAETLQYLGTSPTMNHKDDGFRKWMKRNGLMRKSNEDSVAFGFRVFGHFMKHAKYGGDTSGYASRMPSAVCESFANDCGGLSLLFVAVLRANGIPARSLFGRWAKSQEGEYGQFHVISEFFVPKSGWVPVDIAVALNDGTSDKSRYFGRMSGFIVFHVDTDLEVADDLHHAWAQYILLQWQGKGDFWKGLRNKSDWFVKQTNITPN